MKSYSTCHVLLADDDEDDQLMLGSLFKQHCPECQFLGVENGQELIHYLEQPDAEQPSLILLDLNMPILGGFDALRHLKNSEQHRTIPVVVLTTSEEPEDINRSYQLGANAFLTKPGSHTDLKTMVVHIRDFWLKLAKLPEK